MPEAEPPPKESPASSVRKILGGAQKTVEDSINIDKQRLSAIGAIIRGGLGIIGGVIAMPFIPVAAGVVSGALIVGTFMTGAGTGALLSKWLTGTLKSENEIEKSKLRSTLLESQIEEAKLTAKLAAIVGKGQTAEAETLAESRTIDAKLKEKYKPTVSPDENNPQRLQ